MTVQLKMLIKILMLLIKQIFFEKYLWWSYRTCA